MQVSFQSHLFWYILLFLHSVSVAVTCPQIPLGMMMNGGRPYQHREVGQRASDSEMRINIQLARCERDKDA